MKIRDFDPGDAAAVASLWQYWFRGKSRQPDAGLVDLVRRIYVENPGVDDEIKSLVAVDDNGRILGFLGVSVTDVSIDGRPGKMAGVFPSVVDPDAPTTVAAFLLRKFMAGPQDFTFSDGGHTKFERIWELLGGRILQLQSMRWIKVFRPSRVALSNVSSRLKAVATLEPLLKYVAGGSDLFLSATLRGRLAVTEAGEAYSVQPLTPALMASISEDILKQSRLRPIYREQQVAWQQKEMTKIVEQGEFRARLVRAANGSPVGWYIYYLNPGAISRVYSIEARPGHLDGVLGSLFWEADSEGAGALIGRMEPRLRGPLHRAGAFVHNGGSLQMAHSRDQTLIDDAELGRLAFSRLQGENWYWWAIDSARVP